MFSCLFSCRRGTVLFFAANGSKLADRLVDDGISRDQYHQHGSADDENDDGNWGSVGLVNAQIHCGKLKGNTNGQEHGQGDGGPAKADKEKRHFIGAHVRDDANKHDRPKHGDRVEDGGKAAKGAKQLVQESVLVWGKKKSM